MQGSFETGSQRRKNEETFRSLNFPWTNPILLIRTPWLIPLHLFIKFKLGNSIGNAIGSPLDSVVCYQLYLKISPFGARPSQRIYVTDTNYGAHVSAEI